MVSPRGARQRRVREVLPHRTRYSCILLARATTPNHPPLRRTPMHDTSSPLLHNANAITIARGALPLSRSISKGTDRCRALRWRCPRRNTHTHTLTLVRVACEQALHTVNDGDDDRKIDGAQRYLFSVEYIGTRFSGSQWQPGQRTVVGALQDAFQQFTGHAVSVVCSSRTDAGVHAISNGCHVDILHTSKRRPGEVLPPFDPAIVRRATNHFLQKNEGDVTITDIRCVPMDFHARFMAIERIYYYRLLTGYGPLSLFERGRAWHVPQELNISAMQEACKVLVGSHDFSSFRGARCQSRSPVKTLDELSVSEVESSMYISSRMGNGLSCLDVGSPAVLGSNAMSDQEFGQSKRSSFIIKARARSFLYHQVRLLVGVLKSVGVGDLMASDVERILHARTVSTASPMAPPWGLYLGHVKYNLD